MIIGIGHKARNGKDTVAECLKKKYGFTILRFADALYEECRNCEIRYNQMWGIITITDKDRNKLIYKNDENLSYFKNWITNNFHERIGKICYYYGMIKKDPTLLQWWGTELRRKQDEDYWVKKVIEKLAAKSKSFIFDKNLNIVIPDMRFPNEAQMIKDFGGEVWKVERFDFAPAIIDKECRKGGFAVPMVVPYIDSSRDPNHPSETALDDYKFDRVLSAKSGDLDSLYKQVDKIMKG